MRVSESLDVLHRVCRSPGRVSGRGLDAGQNSAGNRPVEVHLIITPENAGPGFPDNVRRRLRTERPRIARALGAGLPDDWNTSVTRVLEQKPRCFAASMNILTSLENLVLPSEKRILDYHWQLGWNEIDGCCKEGRIWAYVDEKLIDDVDKGADARSVSRNLLHFIAHPGSSCRFREARLSSATSNSCSTAARPGT